MKNLKASEVVDCSTDFEILRYAQDDRESAQDDGGQCVVSEEILRYAQDDREGVQNDILRCPRLISTVTEFVVRSREMWCYHNKFIWW